MIQIKHRNDLRLIPKTDPAYPILNELCTNLIDNYPQYDSEADGWLVLLEVSTNDFSRPLTEIWTDGDNRLNSAVIVGAP